MAERIEHVRTVTTDDRAANEPAHTAKPSAASTAARIVWFIGGVIIVLLASRFILVLLGANPANSFVNFIYTVSRPFAAPFFGMFNYTTKYGVSRFELSTLVSIAVYTLVAWGLARLLTIRRPQQTQARY